MFSKDTTLVCGFKSFQLCLLPQKCQIKHFLLKWILNLWAFLVTRGYMRRAQWYQCAKSSVLKIKLIKYFRQIDNKLTSVMYFSCSSLLIRLFKYQYCQSVVGCRVCSMYYSVVSSVEMADLRVFFRNKRLRLSLSQSAVELYILAIVDLNYCRLCVLQTLQRQTQDLHRLV